MNTPDQKQNGFTIIELLVVVAIIGLLSSIVLTSLNAARIESQNTKYVSEMISLRNAILIDKSNTGIIVGSGTYNDATGSGSIPSTTSLDSGLASLVTKGLIPEIPHYSNWPSGSDPVNSPYTYTSYTVNSDTQTVLCGDYSSEANADAALSLGLQDASLLLVTNDDNKNMPGATAGATFCGSGGCDYSGEDTGASGVERVYCLSI